MNHKFHAISMCSLIAAFAATSAFAAVAVPGCSSDLGFKLEGGVCYYDMPTTGDATTITIPADLKTFKVRYKGQGDKKFTHRLNIQCEKQDLPTTVSVSAASITAALANAFVYGPLFQGSLSIRNRINVLAFSDAKDDEAAANVAVAAAYLEDYQSKIDMVKMECDESCSGDINVQNKEKIIGFNSLSFIFNLQSDNGQSFELTVDQEPYDFGPMQVYYLDGLDKEKINDLISGITTVQSLPDDATYLAVLIKMSGLDITVDEVLAMKKAIPLIMPSLEPYLQTFVNILNKNKANVALLDGASTNGLTGLTFNIPADSVYFDRTFSTKESGTVTSTIMLPFKIATDNIVGAFEIFAFNRVEENKMFIKAVYCSDDNKSSYCPKARKEENGTLTAYNAYIVRLKSDKLGFNGGVTLVETPSGKNPTDVLGEDGDWAFRGTLNYKKWDKNVDDELTACNGKSCAYGYAASDDKLGQFVRIGDGAYIFPFRGYLVNTNPPPATKLAPANASYVLRPTVDIPDEMEIVVDGDNGQTTSIGRFDTRTGEIHINNMKHSYDLKGRRVNGTNNARGAYYGKKVLMK